MAKMRAVDAAMYVLEKEGITTAFGVLGAAINLFYLAMRKHGGICYILARYVEGALHMAEGYTCATAGNIGVCLGTFGFAGTDMITALYFAFADFIFILCITGQALRARLHKEDFQAVDIEAIAKLVSKMAVTVCEAALVLCVLQQAFYLMRFGCLGLVLVDLLFDVQVAEIEFDFDMYELLPVYKPAASRMQIEKAVEMLIQAERLVIVAGGGVINADAAALLQQFAELTSVLVILTLMGWGCIPDDYELMAGMVGLQTAHRYGNATLLAFDMVFGIGNCFANCYTGLVEKYTEGRKIVYIDIELTQIGCVLCLDFGIVFDAKAALTLLVEVAQEMQKAGCLLCCKEWVADCQQRKRTLLRKTYFDNVPVKPQRVYEEMNKAFGCDVCYVTTIGLLQIAAAQMLHVFKDCYWINCGQAGLLGWTILAALGVCAADLKRNVVAIFGDFDFQFLIEELAVGAQFNILYIYVLVNNAYLGLICQLQRAFDMDYCVQLAFENINFSEVNGYGVDYVKVAEGLGCKAIWVFKLEDIAPAFEQAKALMAQYWVLVVVEVIFERVTNILMGSELDNVMEFEDIADNAADALTETCFMHYE